MLHREKWKREKARQKADAGVSRRKTPFFFLLLLLPLSSHSVFRAVLMCSDKPTVCRWRNRHNTTDEGSQLVVRGSHMLLVSPPPPPPRLHPHSLSLRLTAPPPHPSILSILAVAESLKSVISQTFDLEACCIDCTSEVLAHSHCCSYIGCEEPPYLTVIYCSGVRCRDINWSLCFVKAGCKTVPVVRLHSSWRATTYFRLLSFFYIAGGFNHILQRHMAG